MCDNVGIFSRMEAARLLEEGIRKGFISVKERNRYPQNVWVVNEEGWPLEAQLENPGKRNLSWISHGRNRPVP
ncbi:MAG: hypothetical protein ABSG91_05655 [Syntrophobacteraceae bacterium]|jgi:hypothetical protein